MFRGATGLVVLNPPYGERLGSESELRPLYEAIGGVLREQSFASGQQRETVGDGEGVDAHGRES